MALIVLFVSFMRVVAVRIREQHCGRVTVSPSTLSMVAGQVVTISAAAVNSANTAVRHDVYFQLIEYQNRYDFPQGTFCAGVWILHLWYATV